MFRYRVRHYDFLGNLFTQMLFNDLESALGWISDRSASGLCVGDTFSLTAFPCG